MNYNDALKFLEQASQWEKKYTLEKMLVLASLLGNPQNDLKIIHITGTNGKGSTSAIISSILAEQGYKVGFFSSPHLTTIRERFRINGKIILKDRFAEILETIIPAINKMKDSKYGPPSYFELITAIAIKYFYDEKVDYTILEVGLGGRLDATNIITPICSVITNIDIDHPKTLGNSRAKIAYEKAGIIKKNIPVITGVTNNLAFSVIEKKAKEMNSEIILKNRDYKFKILKTDKLESKFKFYWKNLRYKNYVLEKLLGDHQVNNAALALAVISKLKENGLEITDESLYNGIKNAVWEGRFEILSKDPLIIIDGGHNLSGSQAFLRTAKKYIKKDNYLITGILRDKNIKSMMNNFCKLSSDIIISLPDSARAPEIDVLKRNVELYGKKPIIIEDVKNAVDHVWFKLNNNKGLFIVGSIYLIGAAREYIMKKLNKYNELEDI